MIARGPWPDRPRLARLTVVAERWPGPLFEPGTEDVRVARPPPSHCVECRSPFAEFADPHEPTVMVRLSGVLVGEPVDAWMCEDCAVVLADRLTVAVDAVREGED